MSTPVSAITSASPAKDSTQDWVKYAAIAGGVTVAGVALAYVLFGGDDGDAKAKKKAAKKKAKEAAKAAGGSSPKKQQPTVKDLPEGDDEEDEVNKAFGYRRYIS